VRRGVPPSAAVFGWLAAALEFCAKKEIPESALLVDVDLLTLF